MKLRILAVTFAVSAFALTGALFAGAAPKTTTVAPVEMNFACALKSNGLMRYVTNLNQCKSTENKITIKPGPTRICIQPGGSVRFVTNFNSPNCKQPAIQITLPPASGNVYFCAWNTTGVLRYVTDPSQCSATNEFPVFVGPNDQAPSVSSTSPTNGATNVGVSTNITINFSEPVTFTTSSFTLQCPSGTPKTFSVSGSGTNQAVLDPTADLPEGTVCAVKVIANQIHDVDSLDPPDTMAADYNFSFTTDSAPTVSSTNPLNGATGVNPSGNIQINFSEPVTAGGSSFTIECPAPGNTQAYGVTGSGTATITLSPTFALPASTVCTVTVIANQISDVDTGDPPDNMAANYVFSFTTADAAPFVSSTTPTDGATHVAVNTNITINFSDVDVTTSSFSIVCDGNPQTFGVSGSGTSSITLDPTSDLPTAHCTVTAIALQISDSDTGDPPDHPAANASATFATADAAPSVSTTSPTDTADHVAVNTNITINFSEPVTFSNSSFTLECPTGSPASFSASGSGTSTATLDPTSNLPQGTVCSVKVIATGISDVDTVDPPDNMAADYNFSFTTDAAPTVTTTSPTNGATGVDPSGDITVNFSEAVNATTSSFSIECPAPGNLQTFAVSGSGTSAITLNPNSDLPGATTCTVTVIANQISDVDTGDPPDNMAANYVFSFTTQDAAPFVSSTTPANGATDVARDTTIQVNFSESISATSNAFTLECPTGTPKTFSQSSSPALTITLTPTANLPAGTVCTITVHKDEISDTDAVDPPDHMAADYVFSFTTKANVAPTDIQLSNSSIAENQPSGTDIGTLTTTDPDVGDTHTYTLENTGCGGGPFPDNSSFQIGGVSNDKLQSAASFDFETKSSYTICVRTTDSGPLSFDKQFTISVTNVNEPPTDISLSNNNIDENKPSGSLVGNLSQVGDPDSGETYTFTLLTSGCSGSFPDSSSFQISGSQLQSAVSFNFEVKNSYTICVRVNDPGSPSLSFSKQFTISINDVNDNPVDGNESVSAVGNTLLEYGSVPSPSSAAKKVLAGNLLANATDEDQPPQTLSISASDTTSANGGSVSVSAAGAFSYVPPAGFTGTDTFNYTVSDGNGGTDTSTVTVTVSAPRVWYVKNNASPGGLGRSTDPFDTLAEADTAANAAGDITYVYKGDGTTTGLTGGFSLLANQKLLGEPVNLVVGADTLATGTPANRPSLSGTVALASGSRVEAVDIAGSAGAAIAGTNTGGSDVTNVNLSGGAGGVALTGLAGGTFNFTNFTINTTGGTGFLVNGTGVPTINVGSGSTENVSATGGPAVDVRNANSASSLAFDAVSSTNSSGAGINLDNNGATPFSASSGSISGAAGNAIDINAGSGNVTYPGTLGNGAGNTADITGRTGGAISLSGNINDTNDAGGGITMSGNTGGSTTFSGTTKTLNTGASAAFSSTGSAQTITFSGGGLNIDTTSGAGFSATGGGTVNVTGTVNTIDTTTGTALTVSSTNIGASGLSFKSISANGAANGIVLNTTGASGSLVVAGNGNASVGGDSSGGTIQNTTGHGISLNSTLSPSLTNMNIQSTGGSGVDGQNVTNFTFANGTINNSGNAVGEANIAFNGSGSLAGNNINGTLSVTNSVLTNAFDSGLHVENDAGTLSNATITGNTITSSNSTATSKGTGINVVLHGTGSGAANLTKATISGNTIRNFPAGAGIQVFGGNANASGPGGTIGTPGNATNVISITNNTVRGFDATNRLGTDAIAFSVNGGNSGSRSQGNFDVSNNGTVAQPIGDSLGAVILVGNNGYATMSATVNSNVIVGHTTVASPGISGGNGTVTSSAETPLLNLTASGNTISQTDGNGILLVSRGVTGQANLTITSNTVTAPLSGVRPGIRVDAGNASSVDDAVCLDIENNTTAGSASGGTTAAGIGLRKQGTTATVNDFGIEGMAATSSPGVEQYVGNAVGGKNPLTVNGVGDGSNNGVLLLSAASGFSNCNTAP